MDEGLLITLSGTLNFRAQGTELVDITDEPNAIYRYYVTDLLTNELLAEIPFKNVSYERAIKAGGAFSGSIEVLEDTNHLDLYNTTMPGKTALYITRNGDCVWGGVIWTRSYSLQTKTLNVNANEFTSYFYHRKIWKTWSNENEATVTVNGGSMVVQLSQPSTQFFSVGSSIKLIFREVSDWNHNGFKTITAWPAPNKLIVTNSTGMPNGVYALTTVYIRTDTYDYIRSLIDSVLSDFVGIYFPNDEIEPAVGVDTRITQYEGQGSYVVITTASPHYLITGQAVQVSNVSPGVDGQFIAERVNDTTLNMFRTTAVTGTTPTPVRSATVTSKKIKNYTATLTTSSPHNFRAGDTVVISGVDDMTATAALYDGTYWISSILSPTSFTYTTASVLDKPLTAVSGGTAVVTPTLTVGTYGSYTANSDIILDYSDNGFSGVGQDPTTYRGYELRTVGEELDAYADNIYGFEYRIDCTYNYFTASFDRTFVMIPIDFPDPPAPGELSPLSRFGADKLVWEYPGNIIDGGMDESAETAATRFFMVGNIGDLGDEASQPYAAATAIDYLAAGWPILDASETNGDIFDEDALYTNAERYLSESKPPMAAFKVQVNGTMVPEVGTYVPGDWCSIYINDPFITGRLQSGLEPRDTVIVRKIDSFKVTVPDWPSYPETVELTLIPEWQVDKVGE